MKYDQCLCVCQTLTHRVCEIFLTHFFMNFLKTETPLNVIILFVQILFATYLFNQCVRTMEILVNMYHKKQGVSLPGE
jgi:hypothetical protein